MDGISWHPSPWGLLHARYDLNHPDKAKVWFPRWRFKRVTDEVLQWAVAEIKERVRHRMLEQVLRQEELDRLVALDASIVRAQKEYDAALVYEIENAHREAINAGRIAKLIADLKALGDYRTFHGEIRGWRVKVVEDAALQEDK